MADDLRLCWKESLEELDFVVLLFSSSMTNEAQKLDNTTQTELERARETEG